MVARLNLSSRRTLPLGRAPRTEATEPAQPAKKPSKPRGKTEIFGPGLPVTLPGTAQDSLLRVRLPIRMTNNNAGRGYRWHASAKFRADCEGYLRVWGLTRTPFAAPVIVRVTRILGPRERLWDSSSVLRGNWKEIEDSLVAMGWFRDDSPRWITATIAAQVSDRRAEGPAIEIEILQGQ